MNGEQQQQPKKKRTWLWIVLGVFMFFVIVAAGGLFFAVSFFRQSMEVRPMSASSAEQEFDAVRARFAGKQPLFQLVDDRAQMVSDPSAKPAAAGLWWRRSTRACSRRSTNSARPSSRWQCGLRPRA